MKKLLKITATLTTIGVVMIVMKRQRVSKAIKEASRAKEMALKAINL